MEDYLFYSQLSNEQQLAHLAQVISSRLMNLCVLLPYLPLPLSTSLTPGKEGRCRGQEQGSGYRRCSLQHAHQGNGIGGLLL
jgi:hypothetical protein